ncbi:glycosyltransferase family 4 protein [Thermoanaerobacter thermohydrosulfuricus]|uniref:Predicted glycosyltransferases n=1 Tax=Caldanaerobacter subterraneus subsp. tengcongensis (strain DSM 15242 / JCM 11007 / NBRC 100824 / MB4) TaxID=273068 RepID=Q8RBZ8_CALS4|nr:glycosyltransferase family 4 protein [Caldanaerobacter subterraneus]AAM23922.1 predicted glycosyltransferases [Caldanaerobacter subterraneus subsp. tengcongensis MB4]
MRDNRIQDVALISSYNPYITNLGGLQIHLLLLEKGLRLNNVNVVTKYYTFSSFEKAKLVFRYPFYKFMSYKDRVITRTKLIEKFFKKQHFEIFQVVNAHDVISGAFCNSKKIVLTLHGYYTREAINYGGFSKEDIPDFERFGRDLEKRAIDKAQRIITVDSRIKEYVVSEFSFPKEKVDVIFNAVDIDIFKPISELEKKQIREELGWGEEDFVVFIPRRYVKKNGVIYAAKAANILKEKDIKFIFAGIGPLKEEILNITHKNKNVKVLEGIPHDEIVKYYKACDVVLIPSITSDGVEEATSLSMLEGMSCGKIVVCTPIGGMKEIIKHGVNGFFVEQKSEEAIAYIIEKIKEDFYKLDSIRQEARKYIEKNHSYIVHARKFIEVYEKAIK